MEKSLLKLKPRVADGRRAALLLVAMMQEGDGEIDTDIERSFVLH